MNTVKRVGCLCIPKQLFRRRLSKKVHATIAKGIIVDGFWVHYSSEKFERMARDAMDVCLLMFANVKAAQQK